MLPFFLLLSTPFHLFYLHLYLSLPHFLPSSLPFPPPQLFFFLFPFLYFTFSLPLPPFLLPPSLSSSLPPFTSTSTSTTTSGATVTKYPRSGRPAKKLFRFSFVEGKIYLTWKGKFGNQGVDLGEVN